MNAHHQGGLTMLQRMDKAFSYFVTESKAGSYTMFALIVASLVLGYVLTIN